MNYNLFFLYKNMSLISPEFEVIIKKLYWENIKYFKFYKPKRVITTNQEIRWENVISYLKENVINKGSLIVLHSSYEALMPSRLSPTDIIVSLRNLLGDYGTLAMPVIRTYDEKSTNGETLNADLSNLVCTYNLKLSNIYTGLIPFFLTKEKDVVISRHPLASMAATGHLATPMMANNIIEDNLPPCGRNSSWAFCVENEAIIVGLGVDLCHSLTITHVAEDLDMERWPIKNWYRKRIFDIVDDDFNQRRTVLEAKPMWGCLYLPFVNYRMDLIKNKILTSTLAGGVVIEIVHARKLINFLRSRNHNGYPYCIPKKFFK